MADLGRTRRVAAILGAMAVAAAGLATLASPAATAAPVATESRPVAPVPIVLGPAPAQPTLVPAVPAPATGGIHAASTASTFVVTYDAGFNANPQAKAAFQFAVDQWSNLVSSSVPITIDASFTTLGSGVLGSAGPGNAFRNFPGAPQADTWYPSALANALNGSDLDPTRFDIVAQFSSSFPSFYFGTDGNTAGKVDFASVVLHELGHGLGFLGIMNVNSGVGTCCEGSGSPFAYDRFTTSNGTPLLSFPDNSVALGNALQGATVRFTGTQATAVNGGVAPRLYAPNSWQSGSSYSHLDENTFPAGNPNSLMTPAIGANEVIHSPGNITLGIFADTGWTVSGLPTVSVGSARVVEGKTGGRVARFNVSLSNPVPWAVSAHYTTISASATSPQDYSGKSGTVTIPANATATSVAINVRGDSIVEGTQKFSVRLSAPVGAVIGRSTGTGTISDDDPGSGLQIAMSNGSIEEGNSGNRTLKLSVTMSSISNHAVSVNFITGDGTAVAGADYTANLGTVVIPAGAAYGTINVTILPDTTPEANETLTVTISGNSRGTITKSVGVATINDDD